jgi:hypothetical protein
MTERLALSAAARLASLAIAALATLATLAGVDHLASVDGSAAHWVQSAAAPRA